MIFNIPWDTLLVWIIGSLAAFYLVLPFFRLKKKNKKCDTCTSPSVTNEK